MPFRQLFTKREQRSFKGVKKEQLAEKIMSFWSQGQFNVGYAGSFQIHAENYQTRLGLRRVADISIQDIGGTVLVDIMFSATLGDEEAVIGAVGAIVVLPVAVAVGAVSYMEYENDANNMISAFWAYIESLVATMGGSPSTMPVPSVAFPAPVKSSCPKCGATIDADSRFCKICGNQIAQQP